MAKDRISANPTDILRKKEKSKALKKNKKQRDTNLINRDATKMLEKVERLQELSKTTQQDRRVTHKLSTIQAQYEKLMKLKKESEQKNEGTTTDSTSTKSALNQPHGDVSDKNDEYEEDEDVDFSIMPADLPLPPNPFPAPLPTTPPPDFAFPKSIISQDEAMGQESVQLSENTIPTETEKITPLNEPLLNPETNINTNPLIPNLPNMPNMILPPPPMSIPNLPLPPHHLIPPPPNLPLPPNIVIPPQEPIGVPRNVSITAVPVKNVTSNPPTNTEKEKDKEKEKEKEQESLLFIPHSLRVKRTEPLPEKSNKPAKIHKPSTTPTTIASIPSIPIATGIVTTSTPILSLRLPSVNLAPTVSSVSTTDEKMDDDLSEFMNEIEDLEGS